MRKVIGLGLILGLLAGASMTPATAGKKAKPVATKLFLHGATPLGENDSMAFVNDVFLPMDAVEPSGGQSKSRQILNYVAGPNPQCAGNNLFPVWVGEVAGSIKGDIKLTFSTIGTPGPVVVRVWPDVASLQCDSSLSGASDYPEPAGEVTVDLPPGAGTVEAVMESVNFKAAGTMMLQISPAVLVDVPDPGGTIFAPVQARVLYDSTDFASVLEFKCTPASGKSCTP